MKVAATLIGILLVFVIGWVLGWTSDLVVGGVNSETVLQSATIFVTVAIAVWTYRATKRKEAEARLFSQKATVFEPLVEQLKRVHLAGKQDHPVVDDVELANALVDVQFKAIVWADQKFLQTLIDFSEGKPGDSPEMSLGRMARLYEQMRRELGHNDSAGSGYDVVELLLIPQDRPIARRLKAKAIAMASKSGKP